MVVVGMASAQVAPESEPQRGGLAPAMGETAPDKPETPTMRGFMHNTSYSFLHTGRQSLGENRVSLSATRTVGSGLNTGTSGGLDAQGGSPTGTERKTKALRIMGIMSMRPRPKRDASFTTLRDKVVDKVIRSQDFVTRHAGTHGELLKQSDGQQLGLTAAAVTEGQTASGTTTASTLTAAGATAAGLTSPTATTSRHTTSSSSAAAAKKKKAGSLASRWFIFMPHSRARRFMSYLTASAILTATVLAPFELAFISQKRPTRAQFTAVLTLYAIMDATFIIEILCQFRTAYRNYSGLLETNSKQIARRYVQSYRFLVDLSGAFPYGLVGCFVPTWYYIKLAEFFKLAFVMRITAIVANDGSGSTKNMSMMNSVQLLRLFATFLILTHWSGCLWRKLNIYEGEASWTYLANSGGSSQFDGSFSASSYSGVIFSSASMLLGANMLPRTVKECYFVIVSMLFGAILNAVLFGQVNVILQSFNRRSTRYLSLLEEVRENLDGMSMPEGVRDRGNENDEYQWRVNHCVERERFMASLSPPLQSEISFLLYGKMMTRIPFFVDLSAYCQVAVCNLIKARYFLPGDHVVNQGEATSSLSCMYFTKHGKLGVTNSDRPEVLLRILQDGDFFGELPYIARGALRSSTVIALTMCDCGSLTYGDLDNLLKEYPQEQAALLRHISAQVHKYQDGGDPSLTTSPGGTHHSRMPHPLLMSKKASMTNIMVEKLERLEKRLEQVMHVKGSGKGGGDDDDDDDEDGNGREGSTQGELKSLSSPPPQQQATSMVARLSRGSSITNMLKPRGLRRPSLMGGSPSLSPATSPTSSIDKKAPLPPPSSSSTSQSPPTTSTAGGGRRSSILSPFSSPKAATGGGLLARASGRLSAAGSSGASSPVAAYRDDEADLPATITTTTNRAKETTVKPPGGGDVALSASTSSLSKSPSAIHPTFTSSSSSGDLRPDGVTAVAAPAPLAHLEPLGPPSVDFNTSSKGMEARLSHRGSRAAPPMARGNTIDDLLADHSLMGEGKGK